MWLHLIHFSLIHRNIQFFTHFSSVWHFHHFNNFFTSFKKFFLFLFFTCFSPHIFPRIFLHFPRQKELFVVNFFYYFFWNCYGNFLVSFFSTARTAFCGNKKFSSAFKEVKNFFFLFLINFSQKIFYQKNCLILNINFTAYLML